MNYFKPEKTKICSVTDARVYQANFDFLQTIISSSLLNDSGTEIKAVV